MEVENPEELIQVLLNNPASRNALSSFIEQTVKKNHDVMKDAFQYEFKDRIDPSKVPWSEIDPSLCNEIYQYIHEMMAFDEDGNAVVPPSRGVIIKRVKRYYRSQRHQQITKADQEKRRRQRFINRRNRLTMEKRDRAVEEAQKKLEQELTKEEINKIRSEIPMVGRQEIGRVPDSDDEDAKKDLQLKRKINLENGRRVARENQRKGSRIWHTIKHMSEDTRLHVRDVLDMAGKENVPQAHPSAAEKQVSAPLTPLESSTASSSNAVLRSHQQKSRLALQKNKKSASTTSRGVATCTSLGHSREHRDLMATAGAIRSSTTIDFESPDHISFLDNFLFDGDFND
ncbi:uncharacterized protein [Montipora capricornis]|uniref:uncharacterized protein isoform X2 n=1 Tax=Montipora capricornis TaxID=246305 RepID=UPI0035F1182D